MVFNAPSQFQVQDKSTENRQLQVDNLRLGGSHWAESNLCGEARTLIGRAFVSSLSYKALPTGTTARHSTQKVHSGQIEGNTIVCYSERMMRLLIATRNAGKRCEYAQLLAGRVTGVTLCWPQEMGLTLKVQESGATYVENARLKALAHARASAVWTLADDSGLEVDALNGEPGLHSARYSGQGASDEDRYRLLLHRLKEVPWAQRSARFRCVLVLAAPSGEMYTAEGICEGMVALEPSGEHGFGYDPVFYLPCYGQTMAQLAGEVKNRISHRARAVEAMLPTLQRVLVESVTEGQAWAR